ncbi:MAG: hypothetical protein ACFCAD_09890 [Pleurocapsa sp.]
MTSKTGRAFCGLNDKTSGSKARGFQVFISIPNRGNKSIKLMDINLGWILSNLIINRIAPAVFGTSRLIL